MSYPENRAFTDRFTPEVCRIVGPFLLEPSPFKVDTERAGDLVVLKAEPITIGVRIRRHGYFDKWPFDFTIRAHLDNGCRTELAKVMDGWMDWLFYGHAGEAQPAALTRWMLVDMDVWRRETCRHGWRDLCRRRMVVERHNGDGTHFVACDVRLYPPDLLKAASFGWPIEEAA